MFWLLVVENGSAFGDEGRAMRLFARLKRKGRDESRKGPEEWVEIMKWGRRDPGWIPRRVLESMEIDCSPLDHREVWMGKNEQGTVWFNEVQAKAIRNHPEFDITEATDEV